MCPLRGEHRPVTGCKIDDVGMTLWWRTHPGIRLLTRPVRRRRGRALHTCTRTLELQTPGTLKHNEWRRWESYWPQSERHTSFIRTMMGGGFFKTTLDQNQTSYAVVLCLILNACYSGEILEFWRSNNFSPHLICFSFKKGHVGEKLFRNTKSILSLYISI